MNILLFSDHTFLPHRAGGRESSINDMANFLLSKGHFVIVLVKKPKDHEFSSDKINFKYELIENQDPFERVIPVYLTRKIDLIITTVDGKNYQKIFSNFPYGTCIFLRDDQNLSDLNVESLQYYSIVSNSQFLAKKATGHFSDYDIKVEDFPPLIDLDSYKIEKKINNKITLINPVKKKGIDLLLKIHKKRPDLPLLICEGWPLSEIEWENLKSKFDLKTVQFMRRQIDMKNIYQLTKILLVPSQWEEAWGRVVTEAQSNGIPCIVSNVGGLGENCGDGGYVIDELDEEDIWIEKIDLLLNDEKKYKEKSILAYSNNEKYKELILKYNTGLLNKKPKSFKQIENEDLNLTCDKFLKKYEKNKKDNLYLLNVYSQRIKNRINQENELYIVLYLTQNYEDLLEIATDDIIKNLTEQSILSLFLIASKKLNKWDRTLEIIKHVLTLPNTIKTSFLYQSLGEAYFNTEKYTEALNIFQKLINEYPFNIFWIQKCCEIYDLLNDNINLDLYTDTLLKKQPENIKSIRFRAKSKLKSLDNQGAINLYQLIIDRFSDVTNKDYSELIFILLKEKRYEEAFFYCEKAAIEFPENFKGPAYQNTDSKEIDENNNLFKIIKNYNHSIKNIKKYQSTLTLANFRKVKEKKIICSWPGVMSGNRVLENFKKAFVNDIFIPIDMPSYIVVEDADILIIQWPDVILWRNKDKNIDYLISLILNELIAIHEWKLKGVKLVWLVHNLMPHDIDKELIEIWSFFYDFLGSIVDEFLSMCPSNELIIRNAIPSLSLKKYSYFYHPRYYLNNITPEEKYQFKEFYGIDSNEVIISILGSIGGYKGLNAVIEAFNKSKFKNIKLLIAGNPRNKKALEEVNLEISGNPQILLLPKLLSNYELDLIALASDKLIVPNFEYLNSGAIVYSLCAGKPTLALNKEYAIDVKNHIEEKEYLTLIDNFYDLDKFELFMQSPRPINNFNAEVFSIQKIYECFNEIIIN